MARKPRRTLSAALAREGEVAEPQTPGKQLALPEATPAPGAPETVRYTAYLPRPVYRQLKELAFTHDRKMHEFVLEGLDLVFREHGLRSIHDLTAQDE
jgi:Antitoxin-like ribbon-helix-helix